MEVTFTLSSSST